MFILNNIFTTYWYFSKNVRSTDGSIKTDGCSKARHRNPKKVEEGIWYPPSSYQLFLQYLSRWCMNKWYTVASYYSLLSCNLECYSILRCIVSYVVCIKCSEMMQYFGSSLSWSSDITITSSSSCVTRNHFIMNQSFSIKYIYFESFTSLNLTIGNDDRYVSNVRDVRYSVFESLIRSIEHRKLELHRKFPKTESLKVSIEVIFIP